MSKFDVISKHEPVISPAFRWGQSLTEILIEVKYATRFDSPACLDTFDHKNTVLNQGDRQ